MTTCRKDYSIKVGNPTVMRYWTMEETANNNRVDSVNGDIMSVLNIGANLEAIAGVQGNAVHFQTATAGNEIMGLRTTQPHALSPNIPSGSTSLSLSCAFWFKLLTPGTTTSPINHPESYVEASSINFNNATVGISSYSVGAAPVKFVFWWEMPSGYGESVLAMPDANWHFWHVFYDYPNNKVGYSIDNGAETTVAVPFQPPQAVPTYFVDSATVCSSATTIFDQPQFVLDEVLALFGDKLTAAQVTYLYNGGVGRTWPIVLP